MAMEMESLHRRNGETGAQTQQVSTLTTHSKSSAEKIRKPSQTRSHLASTNLLPSKFDKLPGRPLPPLEGRGSQVPKNDSRTSLKPAKLSDHRSQPSLPLKGQHMFMLSTAKASTQTTPRVIKVQTATLHETECTEHTVSVDDCDLAKNRSKNSRSPAPLQRSSSVSRLSRSSVTSLSNSSRKLPRSSSRSSDTRTDRSATPQRLAVNKNADRANKQVSVESVSAINESESAATQIPQRHSNSVSSSVHVPLHKTNPSRPSSPLTPGRETKKFDVSDSVYVDGKPKLSSAMKNSSSHEFSDLRNVIEQLPSNHHYRLPVHSTSLEQDMTDAHLYKVKPFEESSSNHGMLGGKSDDEEKSAIDIEQKIVPGASQRHSVVRVKYFFLLIFLVPRPRCKLLSELGSQPKLFLSFLYLVMRNLLEFTYRAFKQHGVNKNSCRTL